MCTYDSRVFRCGHYKKTLILPCKEAKKKREVCDSGSETSSTTGVWCLQYGCDKKPSIKREGPGYTTNGGFDPYGVAWDMY